MDISSLSSQLNISTQELRVKAKEKGIFISPRANKIDNQLAKKILDALTVSTDSTDKKSITEMPSHLTKIKLPSYIKVRDFAITLNLPVTEVIRTLIHNGVMATINEEIDFETASIVAQDLGFEVETETNNQEAEFGMAFLQKVLSSEQEKNLKPRPPIVAIMGHVDHGKTTLLDTLRKTSIVETESGGITQHIGAYQVAVKTKNEFSDKEIPRQARDDFAHKIRKITFLDTPGHEAFSEMRARGANVTDIIVLVVAADDGVKPQTLEVINRAKFTNTPLIVAINKIDKPEANATRIKQELAGVGILTEEWGGKIVACEISAKKNIGLDSLLEMILLTAELENFKANPEGQTAGTIIESKIMQGKGPTATVIIQNGQLKVGDIIVAGPAYGRVRSLDDEHGKKLKEALPSTPAQISGLSELPHAGDILQVTDSLDNAKTMAIIAQKKLRSSKLAGRKLIGDIESKTLNLILKADMQGSLEAIKQSVVKLKNEEVKINILSEGIGEVNESDVLLAESSKSTILAFRIKTSAKSASLAKIKQVVIDSYDVIYELIEDVTSAVLKMFTPEMEKITIGRGKVLAIFRTEKEQMIVGGKVEEGEIKKIAKISVWRNGQELGRGEILDLQQSKVATKSVLAGNEFGMKIKTNVKIEIGDVLESFEEKSKQKTL